MKQWSDGVERPAWHRRPEQDRAISEYFEQAREREMEMLRRSNEYMRNKLTAARAAAVAA